MPLSRTAAAAAAVTPISCVRSAPTAREDVDEEADISGEGAANLVPAEYEKREKSEAQKGRILFVPFSHPSNAIALASQRLQHSSASIGKRGESDQ
jgi:hypothetical protein